MSAPGVLRAERFEVSEVKPLPGVESLDLGHLAWVPATGARYEVVSPATGRAVVQKYRDLAPPRSSVSLPTVQPSRAFG
jgi:hypothetical protein